MAGREKKTELIGRVLRLDERLYWAVSSMLPNNWLNLGLTVTQVKMLLLLSSHGRLRMGDLASALGKNAKTATGIVNRLVSRGIVVREDDANDRRVVRCKLSDEGRGLINHIFEVGDTERGRVRDLLREMTVEELSRLAVALEEVDIHFRKAWEAITEASPANKQEFTTQGQKNRHEGRD